MNLPKAGTMRTTKKVIGWASLAIGACLIFKPGALLQYPVLAGIVVAAGGYFHAIAGRQR